MSTITVKSLSSVIRAYLMFWEKDKLPSSIGEGFMNKTLVMRVALWATAFFNVWAAVFLIFPASLQFPAPVPYFATILALVIGGFGFVYAWLACRSEIDRPLVVVAALGKIGVFAVTFRFWLDARVLGREAGLAGVDLMFAAIFVWWLSGERR